MVTKRRVALVGARMTAGLAGIVVVVVAVGGAALAPWPAVVSEPEATLVTPVASDQTQVCPGPLLTLAADSSQADVATSVSRFDTVYGARAAGTGGAVVDVTRSDLAAVENAESARDGAPQLLTVPAGAAAQAAALVNGAQSQNAASETLGGLATSACTAADSDSWLVGGSTDVGRTSLVLLSNPSTVVATVDLTVYGETGQVDAPGSTGILVQPGTQRIISLAGLAPNLLSPVVHVQATGGQVAAALQQSVISGIQPGGAELLGPTTDAATEQVIPGVVVTPPGAEVSVDEGAVSEDTPTVRVLVPGDAPATVSVGVQSEDGASAGTSLEVVIQPGLATEIPLSGIAPGNYTVSLAGDQPLVAAALTTVTGTATRDFTWASAAAAQADEFLVYIAPGPAPALHLANTSDVDSVLTLTADGGAVTTLTVPAGQSVVTGVTESIAYLVTGGEGIAASVGYSGDGLASSYTVSPIGALVQAIPVYPR
ncbi:DUF5719 family protein [Cryobacterium sp.]|jgi:hypothetical protein|uniref:DUF5719 family protein n=1 Tax=Cryobacterium sp. TaxID=1926290 RepID=UPI00260AB88E|nr:DUF5719 family protein [Cryobacterium sp.]MCU1444897.1 hypothetical protein [Cryobacterium sp.]